jgi:hypothetical protein
MPFWPGRDPVALRCFGGVPVIVIARRELPARIA